MKKPDLGILVKPASSDCNLACDYCYYRHVDALYPDADGRRMSPDVLEAVCRQYRALEPNELSINWQGGEPTLMGLDFFRRAVEIEAGLARPGEPWRNNLQTNGVLLDDEWCGFLAANGFLVGLSMDGPAELNTLRRARGGQPAFDAAMRALALLKQHGAEFNVLVVISRANADRPAEVLRFLVEGGCRFVQFIPCTEPAGAPGCVTEHSVSSDEYAAFMTGVFDAWVALDDPSIFVRHVDNWLHLFFGLRPECCEYRPECSDLLTVEWNGDVYPCDFFVEPGFLLGNVREQTLERMLQGREFRDFVRQAEHVPAACAGCEWLGVCQGGCYRHRRKLGVPADGVPYLCGANKRIFGHVFPRLKDVLAGPEPPRLHAFMNRIAARVAGAGRPARDAEPAAAAGSPAPRPEGRNAPCPCGSGRKLKHCCAPLHAAGQRG